MCERTAFGTAAVKMKQLLHLEMAYRKILCFKKHKDSRSCMIQMTAHKNCMRMFKYWDEETLLSCKKDKPTKQTLEEARNILQR